MISDENKNLKLMGQFVLRVGGDMGNKKVPLPKIQIIKLSQLCLS